MKGLLCNNPVDNKNILTDDAILLPYDKGIGNIIRMIGYSLKRRYHIGKDNPRDIRSRPTKRKPKPNTIVPYFESILF